MTDPSCVFCKIVAGEIPCLRIFEDDAILAFMDIGPLAEGHLLVIPRQHYRRLDEMSAEAVASITRQLPRLGQAVMKATGAGAYNILQNNGPESGQVVPHVHFHIIPRKAADGLGYRWNATKYAAGRAEEVQKALLGALKP
jgi:histidine triad (HIT) family protein